MSWYEEAQKEHMELMKEQEEKFHWETAPYKGTPVMEQEVADTIQEVLWNATLPKGIDVTLITGYGGKYQFDTEMNIETGRRLSTPYKSFEYMAEKYRTCREERLKLEYKVWKYEDLWIIKVMKWFGLISLQNS